MTGRDRRRFRAPRRPAAPSRGALEFLGKILVGAAIGGGVLMWFGVKEYRLTRLARAEPQALTCRQLQDAGPGDNAHVIMTDFVLLTDAFAVKSTSGSSTFWSNAWIPAVPADGAFAKEWLEAPEGKRLPPPPDLRVLVQSGYGSEFSMVGKPPTAIQGTVINEIDALDDDVARILAKSYPGFDTGRCWILEQNRVPKSTGVGMAMIGGGLLLILGALGGGLYVYRASQQKAQSQRRFDESRRRAPAERRGRDEDDGDVRRD